MSVPSVQSEVTGFVEGDFILRVLVLLGRIQVVQVELDVGRLPAVFLDVLLLHDMVLVLVMAVDVVLRGARRQDAAARVAGLTHQFVGRAIARVRITV